MQNLLPLLQGLEGELHHPGTRCSPSRLDALLHPQFHEIGRSSHAHGRETVLCFLASLSEHPPVVSEGFEVALLAPPSRPADLPQRPSVVGVGAGSRRLEAEVSPGDASILKLTESIMRGFSDPFFDRLHSDTLR